MSSMQRKLSDALLLQQKAGLKRTLLQLDGGADAWVVLQTGQRLVNFASNNYLGLADKSVPLNYGLGAGASPLVTGNKPVHAELEQALAEFVRADASLLFTSGYAANVGTIGCLVGADDVVFSDALNHASIIDGCRLSRAQVIRFDHLDRADLRRKLEQHRGLGERALVITEAVFSMDGDHAELGPLRMLADEHDAWLYVDEGHSLGVLGPEGRGLAAEQKTRPDVLMGTLSKAVGGQGAFVAGSALLREYLIHQARSYVFSTGLSPLLAGATLHRLFHVKQGDALRARTLGSARTLRAELRRRGFDVRGDCSAISSVIFGTAERALHVSQILERHGILARAIRPPTVPEGTSRIRLVTTAAHTDAHIAQLLHAFEYLQP